MKEDQYIDEDIFIDFTKNTTFPQGDYQKFINQSKDLFYEAKVIPPKNTKIYDSLKYKALNDPTGSKDTKMNEIIKSWKEWQIRNKNGVYVQDLLNKISSSFDMIKDQFQLKNAKGIFIMYICCAYGFKIQIDEPTSFIYVKQAADQEYPLALCQYGIIQHLCYKNYPEALKYYKKAQEYGESYVISSPIMVFEGRHFLAEDSDGTIERVTIYNWHLLQPKKLALLHELGTKVILKAYIRKAGDLDALPYYKIKNPFLIEIIPRTQKHSLTNQKMRKIGKVLFHNKNYEGAIEAYDFLLKRNSEDQHLIYSNIGLCYKNQKKYGEAIKYFQKSLAKNNTYDKSRIQLINCYLELEKYEDLEKQIQLIQNTIEKQNILIVIQKKRQLQRNTSILQKYCKKSAHQKNQIIYLDQFAVAAYKQIGQTPESLYEFQNYKKYDNFLYEHEEQFSKRLKIQTDFVGNNYINQMHKLIMVPMNVEAKVENKLIIKKALEFYYYLIEFQRPQYSEEYTQDYIKRIQSEIFEGNRNACDEVCFQMAFRGNLLEKNIEDQCIRYLQRHCHVDAIQFYFSSFQNNRIFGRKVIDLLMKYKFYGDSLKLSAVLLIKISSNTMKLDFKNISFLVLSILTSLQKLKQHQKLIQYGEEIIKMIKKLYPNHKYFIEEQGNAFKKEPKKIITKTTKIVFLQIYQLISLSFFQQKSYKQSLRYINKSLQNEEGKSELYFECLIHKIRCLNILKLENKAIEQIKKGLLQITFNKIDDHEIFKKHLLKEKLFYHLKNKEVKPLVSCCQLIGQLNLNNQQFIHQKLMHFLQHNHEHAIECFQLIQVSKFISKNLVHEIRKQFTRHLKEYIIHYQHLITSIQARTQVQRNEENSSNQDSKEQQKQGQQNMEKNDSKIITKYDKNTTQPEYQEEVNCSDSIQIQKQMKNINRYIFHFNHGLELYIVIFDLKYQLSKMEEEYFRRVANRLSINRRNGINILKNNMIRLKNKKSRLIGYMEKENHRRYCIFNQIQFLTVTQKEDDQRPTFQISDW